VRAGNVARTGEKRKIKFTSVASFLTYLYEDYEDRKLY
jgi:hypothetical protein